MPNLATYYSPTSIDDAVRVSSALAASGMFPDVKKPEQAFAKMMAGAELGFGPFAALSGVDIIQGRPAIRANLIASAVKANAKYDFLVKEHTETKCTVEFFEIFGSGTLSERHSIGTSTFTMDDAKKASLTSKAVWKQYPRNMLYARAVSNGVRWHCPDVFHGSTVYTHEELGAEEPIEVESIVIQEDKPTEKEKAIEQVVDTLNGDVEEPPPTRDIGEQSNRFYRFLEAMKAEKARIGAPLYYSVLREHGLDKSNSVDKTDFTKMGKVYNAAKECGDYRVEDYAWRSTLDCVESRRMRRAEKEKVSSIADILGGIINQPPLLDEVDSADDLPIGYEPEDREKIVTKFSSEYYQAD